MFPKLSVVKLLVIEGNLHKNMYQEADQGAGTVA